MNARQLIAVLLAGVLFGFGLALSTMVNPAVVLAFLRWQDFGLLLVLGGATTLTFVAYQSLPRLMRQPLFGRQFDRHPAAMDARTLGGAALFGVGWVSAVCARGRPLRGWAPATSACSGSCWRWRRGPGCRGASLHRAARPTLRSR